MTNKQIEELRARIFISPRGGKWLDKICSKAMQIPDWTTYTPELEEMLKWLGPGTHLECDNEMNRTIWCCWQSTASLTDPSKYQVWDHTYNGRPTESETPYLATQKAVAQTWLEEQIGEQNDYC